jgi:RyR domain
MTIPVDQRRATWVYEAARLQAEAMGAPIVPEPWTYRELEFRDQFVDVIRMMCGPDRKTSPEELHDDWMKAYAKMGWRYGTERNAEAKTHPDMVHFSDLHPVERAKDAVFVALCEIARQWIPEF